MASRKDFEKLARIVAQIELGETKMAVESITMYCEDSNPRFDFGRFREYVDKLKAIQHDVDKLGKK